jgi:transcriptional regulator of heat shock response
LDSEDLEGTTLNVYAYVVKEGKPVGPREVMRGTNLSSPSTAYRQLQKLESLGLIQKNVYGSYVVREKASISGHLWIGRNLVPRLMCYSLFFMGIVGTELSIIAMQFFLQNQLPHIELIYLTATNVVAMALFLGEGLLLRRKNRPEQQKNIDKREEALTKTAKEEET